MIPVESHEFGGASDVVAEGLIGADNDISDVQLKRDLHSINRTIISSSSSRT